MASPVGYTCDVCGQAWAEVDGKFEDFPSPLRAWKRCPVCEENMSHPNTPKQHSDISHALRPILR